uniref:polycystic kidney disease protein 1-like 2 n=1 Tax=Oncorhynchus gorbuscha TaxID=8017 RepID=UPI001EAF2AB8|nr:polycystic kidney disease protein 1-like 2 [Oncorhynchus gorbuscha]
MAYEFSQKPKSWYQAQESCKERGGKLLMALNCKIKSFLEDFSNERHKEKLTWWVATGVLGQYQGPVIVYNATGENGASTENGSTPLLCTYVMMDPFQLVTSTNCSAWRGYLCTLDLNLSANPSNSMDKQGASGKSRHWRSHQIKVNRMSRSLSSMENQVTNINMLLKEAQLELERMEMAIGEPTDANGKKYLELLLQGAQMLFPSNLKLDNTTASNIISCAGGVILLKMKRCGADSDTNVDTEMFDLAFEIYKAVSLVVTTESNEPFFVKHPTGSIYQISLTPSQMDNNVLGSEDDAYIKLPSFSALHSSLKNHSLVNVQVTTFIGNPYPSTENITGTVCTLVLRDGLAEISVENLTELIEIVLPRPDAPVLSGMTVSLEEGARVGTTFNTTDPNITVIFTIQPSVNVSLKLLLGLGSPPNDTHYKHSTVLRHTEGYRWLVTPEMMEKGTGTWYVNASLFNSTWSKGLTLQITIFTTKCMYWNAKQLTWSIAGCWVGIQSTPRMTHCLCNHLTSFGSSFFVMPNYVDVSLTAQYFATVNENYVVVALLSAFFGLYLVTLLWACYADRRALTRRKMTFLKDNHPCASYNYLLNVQTGSRRGAGTSANVTVKLLGTQGESEPHHLSDPDKPVFERRGVDLFLVTTPFPLGELTGIQLCHDNSGGHPSWYLNKVTIQDLQRKKVWHFLSSSWLSSDRGDGLTKKTLNAAKKNEIRSFRNIFQTRTSTGFRDQHIWVSIVDPPWRSPFTRAQRVSCCMSLLLCTMAINIAFWKIPKNQQSPVIFTIGSLEVTWEEIMVGVESGLLMFPINILIITIFRSIKPRFVQPKEKNRDMQGLKPLAVTMPTILKDTEEMVNLLCKSQRNKVPELEKKLESCNDLCSALGRVQGVIQLMQGLSESEPHWVYCSKFVLYFLHHLSMCLERLDESAFPTPEARQHILNTVHLLQKTSEMVSTSHMAYSPPRVAKEKRKSSSCWLPWWFVFVGWFLLVSISVVSTYFTLMYGFAYGREKSIQWVISLAMSLFQSIFILQPLKVIGMAIFFALLLKPVAVEDSEEVGLLLKEQQEMCKLYSGREMQ